MSSIYLVSFEVSAQSDDCFANNEWRCRSDSGPTLIPFPTMFQRFRAKPAKTSDQVDSLYPSLMVRWLFSLSAKNALRVKII
jgi:hypothetical protein